MWQVRLRLLPKLSQTNGLGSRISEFQWEYNLIEDNTPNAWAMPGGKIVVYSGILPYTKTVEGLAVVIGHEIAHVVARHGNERMSQGLLIQTGALALSVALAEKPAETQQLFMAAYGIGSTVGISLPFHTHMNTKLIILDYYLWQWQVIILMQLLNSGKGCRQWEAQSHRNILVRIHLIKIELPELRK